MIIGSISYYFQKQKQHRFISITSFPNREIGTPKFAEIFIKYIVCLTIWTNNRNTLMQKSPFTFSGA